MNQKQLARKIDRELLALQSTLTRSLENFYRSKIKNSLLSIEAIRSKYEQEIKNLIRKTIQSSWLFAHTVLEDVIHIRDPKFQINISVNDIQGLEALTNKSNDQFWAVAGNLQLRDSEFFKVNNKSELEPLDPLSLHAAMVAAGLLYAFSGFNSGMQSKRDELGLNIKLKFVTRENCIDTQICLPLNGKIMSVGEVQYSPPLHKHCKCKLIPVMA